MQTFNQYIGAARVYAFGVGNSVNRYLLDAMAEEGRGYARYLPAGEDAGEVAQTLAADLKTPLLTDISIDWGDLAVSDVTPRRIPDLFAGQGVRVYARYEGHETAQVTIRGLVQGRSAQMPVTLTPSVRTDGAGLPLMWARNRIATLTRDVALGQDAAAAIAEITRLGLGFSLQTQNTSFVAVSTKVVNTGGQDTAQAQVASPMPSDMAVQAFSGSSTPEPQAIIGFLLIAAMSVFGLRRRVR